MNFDNKTGLNFERLSRLAILLGASDAKIIESEEISVEDDLAKLCNEPQCENYGLSSSCPPHVSGPEGFRELQKTLKHAMAIRIIVPLSVLYSAERRDIGRLLHEVVAGVEREAVGMGYSNSKAFAAGSCKKIFCHDYTDCLVLSYNGECRYPQYARPSMSGFGINVSKLMKTCGWPSDINTGNTGSTSDSMTWVAGLIMVD